MAPAGTREDGSDASAAPSEWEQVRFHEAMQTFRSVMAAVVPTATALLAGTIALLGFAVGNEQVNWWLFSLAAVPMAAMSILFDRWRWFTRRTLNVARSIERLPDDGLAAGLVDWMGPELWDASEQTPKRRVRTRFFDLMAPRTGRDGTDGRSYLLRSPIIFALLIVLIAVIGAIVG